MSKLFNRLNIVLVLALLLATLFGFAQIPEADKLPAHWNIDGTIDRFGSRDQVLLLLPLAAAAVAGLLAGIELIIRRMGHGDVSRQFTLALSFVLTLFAAKQASTILIGIGHSIDVPRIVAIVQGLGLIVIGNMLPKSGPLTLSGARPTSDGRDRYRVNRTMGLLFMLACVVLFLAAITSTSPKWLFALNIGGVVVVAATSGALYAYLLAKSDSA
jgi:uncharacterized membrane protein